MPGRMGCGIDEFPPCNGHYGVTNNGDCDDTNPSAHPGAREIFSSEDDDCHGTIDGPAVAAACMLIPDAAAMACISGSCVELH